MNPKCSIDIQTKGFWGNMSPTKLRSRSIDVAAKHKEMIQIRVLDPMTLVSKGKAEYTHYRIEVQAPNSVIMALSYSSVRRRYSEFVWLDKKLREETKHKCLPTLPSKKIFRRFSVDFILSRQQHLQEYIERIIKDEDFLCNAHLHLFLQTNFTPNEMESVLERKDHDDVNHIIVLATTNQRHDYCHGNTSNYGLDSSLNTNDVTDNSFCSLDLNDVIASSESFSSGYYGDDEIPDGLDLSASISNPFDVRCMTDVFDSSTSSQEFLSFEDFFEFDDKKSKSRRRISRPAVSTKGHDGLVEFVMPMSKCHQESYVVYSVIKRDRPNRESNEKWVKRLVNEYEVVSLL